MSRTDFARIMDPERREHYVYRAFNADGDLIYVGCSHRLENRMREHKTNSTWYPHMARVRLTGPFTYAKARSLEKAAIKSENPRFNGHTPRRTCGSGASASPSSTSTSRSRSSTARRSTTPADSPASPSTP